MCISATAKRKIVVCGYYESNYYFVGRFFFVQHFLDFNRQYDWCGNNKNYASFNGNLLYIDIKWDEIYRFATTTTTTNHNDNNKSIDEKNTQHNCNND